MNRSQKWDALLSRIQPKRFQSWRKAIEHLEKAAYSRWVFRGQGSSAWSLQTSFDRLCQAEHMPQSDRNAMLTRLEGEFARRARRLLSPEQLPGLNAPAAMASLEWLSLMQHYGAPTSLLDWTYSPRVAAYFAFENADSWCSIWGIDMYQCNMLSKELKRGDDRVYTLQPTDPDTIDLAMAGESSGVFAVEPYALHDRIVTQQGLFTVGGNPSLTFVENLLALEQHPRFDVSEYVFKVDILGSERTNALSDLRLSNISRATLFPGLEGFAQSLRIEAMLWNSAEERWNTGWNGIAGPG